MSEYYTGPASDKPPIYDLYGVANHHGGLLGGHYTAYARLLTDENFTQEGKSCSWKSCCQSYHCFSCFTIDDQSQSRVVQASPDPSL